jgi:uncharacterized protein (TIGR03790 family)
MNLAVRHPLLFALTVFAASLQDPHASCAELLPHHVVILANAASPESVAVAEHYATQRGIPADHIVRLDLPVREVLTRREYDRLVVVPLRRALSERGLAASTRVVVTTYGVPLRVEAPDLSPDEREWLADARRRVNAGRIALEQLQQTLERIAPSSAEPEDRRFDAAQDLLETARTAVLLRRVDRAWQAAVQHAQRLPREESERVLRTVLSLGYHYGGWAVIAQKRPAGGERPLSDTRQMAAWRSLLEQTGPLWSAFARAPVRYQRPLIYRWAERLFGVRGVLDMASAEVDLLTMAYADASFDSELSLLWWDRDLYPVAWRLANPLFQDSAANQHDLPVLMVSRLDAPTAALAKGLVDKALQAERSGLKGTVYFDARGLPSKGSTDTYGLYDQSLRDAAEAVRRHSEYRVVLDDGPETLSTPGAAPDTALYIGWYKLRAYEDVFTFTPGAIGYHMASAEAMSVHDPTERGWCKNALERGITATLGSVGEPYLDAFPEPAQFTRLLLTGQYSLVEVYYLTSRYVSWRMVLFGDPLYNPMRGRSSATLLSSTAWPSSPSERPFGDPTTRSAEALRRQRDRIESLVAILTQAEQATQSPPR